MYRQGDLRITDPECPDSIGRCQEWPEFGHEHIIQDARNDGALYMHPCVFLPHSCNEWVIGGPEQILTMIEDLTKIYQQLTKEPEV